MTGVDNAGKLEFMRSLGADEVIDYRVRDFTRGDTYDLVLDLVAHRSVFAYRRALARGGRYLCVGGSVPAVLRIPTVGAVLGRGRSAWNASRQVVGVAYRGVMAASQVLEVAGREVTITNPDKLVFPSGGLTKLDLVRYYETVAGGALRGVEGRPMILKRFVKGIDQEAFFQKRAPEKRPDWIEVAELRYASGRSADEVVVRDAASLLWVVNLGCIDLNPHPVLAEDLDNPDELRIDLDAAPGGVPMPPLPSACRGTLRF